jgi:hypothetical protein
MVGSSGTGTVQVDGVSIGTAVGGFSDYDGLVEALRARVADVGLSYRILEELAGMPEGGVAKYLADVRVRRLSIESLLQITEAIGVRAIFVTDETLLRKMRPLYEKRDDTRVHARRRAPLGPITLRRVMSPVAAEMGKRGAASRNARLGPELRRKLAQAAARARWQGRD